VRDGEDLEGEGWSGTKRGEELGLWLGSEGGSVEEKERRALRPGVFM
jgi:hypothetical protein